MVTRAESRLDRREIEGLNRRSTALLCGMRDYMDKRRKMEVDPPACSRNRARGACMCGRRRKRACDPLGAAIGARVQTSEEKDARGAKSTAPGRLRLAQPEGPAVGQVRGKTVREWTKEDVAGWLRRSAKRTGSSRSPLLSATSTVASCWTHLEATTTKQRMERWQPRGASQAKFIGLLLSKQPGACASVTESEASRILESRYLQQCGNW